MCAPKMALMAARRTRAVGAWSRFTPRSCSLAAAPEDWRALSMVAETLMKPLAKLDGLALIDALRQLSEERKEQRGRKMGTLGFDGEQ